MSEEIHITDQIGHTQANDTNNSLCTGYRGTLMEERGKCWSTLKMTPSPRFGT